MSNVTLQAVYDAAKAFVADDTQIQGLRDALAAHDAAEANPPTEEPSTETANAETPTEPPAATA